MLDVGSSRSERVFSALSTASKPASAGQNSVLITNTSVWFVKTAFKATWSISWQIGILGVVGIELIVRYVLRSWAPRPLDHHCQESLAG
jgi:hypothetical protein